MTELDINPIRKWRTDHKVSLEEMRQRFAEYRFKVPSTAKLSRIERDQPIPFEMLSELEQITGIPAKELRPDLAKLLGGRQ